MTFEAYSRGRLTEFMLDTKSNLADFLLKHVDLDTEQAESISTEFINHLMRNWGGQQIYIPNGAYIQTTKRDIDLYREFRGNNSYELAKKYNISVQWVYQIVNRMKEIELQSRQTDMFINLKAANDED